jgi:hypothetical protein
MKGFGLPPATVRLVVSPSMGRGHGGSDGVNPLVCRAGCDSGCLAGWSRDGEGRSDDVEGEEEAPDSLLSASQALWSVERSPGESLGGTTLSSPFVPP